MYVHTFLIHQLFIWLLFLIISPENDDEFAFNYIPTQKVTTLGNRSATHHLRMSVAI